MYICLLVMNYAILVPSLCAVMCVRMQDSVESKAHHVMIVESPDPPVESPDPPVEACPPVVPSEASDLETEVIYNTSSSSSDRLDIDPK